MRFEVWTAPDCHRCHGVVALLEDARVGHVVCRDLEDVLSGAEPDVDVMAQLALQGMKAPVIRIRSGEFIADDELPYLVRKLRCGHSFPCDC